MNFARHHAVLLVLAWVGVAASCDRATETEASVSRAPLVVTRGTLEHTVLLTGELEAAQSENLVAPRTDSWAISVRWLAEDGAEVKKGDKLVELDNTAILEQIRDHELAVIQAGIELSSQRATAAVELADKEFEVQTQRINVAKAEIDVGVPAELVSVRDSLQFKLAHKSAKAALISAEDGLEASRKGGKLDEAVKQIALDKVRRKLNAADEQLDALSLTAPRDGVVIIANNPNEGRKLQVGDTVWPGMTVAKIPNLRELTVVAQLSDVDDGSIKPGMKARCVVDAYPDRPIEATVASMSPVAREPEHQSARRFFSVTLTLAEADAELLRPGLSTKVEVLAEALDDVLLAPRAALDTSTDPPTARLESGDVVEVELGLCNPQQCEVLSGLDEGATLVSIETEVAS